MLNLEKMLSKFQFIIKPSYSSKYFNKTCPIPRLDYAFKPQARFKLNYVEQI